VTPWFVVNPHAGGVRYAAVAEAIRRLAGSGATISPHLPHPEGSASRLVVAVGGDGTVSRVINACDPRSLRLGLIPRGSANDLGRELAIPADLGQALRVIQGGRFADIDLIDVNGARFATCGGLGLATEVAARANAWKKRAGWHGRLARRLGSLIYAVAALVETRANGDRGIRATISAPGFCRRALLTTVLISNQPRFGGRFSASPLASNQDGEIHLCGLTAPLSRARVLRVCLEIYRGTAGRCPEIFQFRAPSASIETEEEVPFFGDGEVLARGRHFRIEVLPRALKVAVPRPAFPELRRAG
jgi:YegS/Rv2252/BmrU family lipid kinase